VETVANFYRELFDLPELERHTESDGALRSIWLDMGGTILMVERTTGVGEPIDGPINGIGKGPFLLAFKIATDERKALERKLQMRGISIESRTSFTSYARDPEGNKVALCHYPAPERDR